MQNITYVVLCFMKYYVTSLDFGLSEKSNFKTLKKKMCICLYLHVLVPKRLLRNRLVAAILSHLMNSFESVAN